MIPSEKIFAVYSIPNLSVHQRVTLAESPLSADEILNLRAHSLGECIGVRVHRVPEPLVDPFYYDAALTWQSRPGNRYVSILDSEYPPLLREISDPPFLLTYVGSLSLFGPSISVVGTRKATELGRLAAFAFGLQCADNNLAVISGLARGIDSAVQEGVTSAGGIFWGVTGGGLEHQVRKGGRTLHRILDAGGAVMSEFHPLSYPLRWHFPVRNRVISGITPVTLVVQAPRRSGALITADHALRQGREVVVHGIGLAEGLSSGVYQLAEEGARIITSLHDIEHPSYPDVRNIRPVQFLRSTRAEEGYDYRYGTFRLGFSCPLSL